MKTMAPDHSKSKAQLEEPSLPVRSSGHEVDATKETPEPAQNLPPSDNAETSTSYPNGFLQILLVLALYLAMFLVALDMVR